MTIHREKNRVRVDEIDSCFSSGQVEETFLEVLKNITIPPLVYLFGIMTPRGAPDFRARVATGKEI